MIFHTVFLKLKLMILTGNHIYLVVPFHQWSDSHWYPHFLYHLLSLTFFITLLSVNFSAQTDFNYSNILTSSTNVPLLPSDHPFITHWPSALHFMHIHIRICLPSFLSLSLFCISVSLLFSLFASPCFDCIIYNIIWNLNNSKTNTKETGLVAAAAKGTTVTAGQHAHAGLPQLTRYEYWRNFTTIMALGPQLRNKFRRSLLGLDSTARSKVKMSFIGFRTTKRERGSKRRSKAAPPLLLIIFPCTRDQLLLLTGNLKISLTNRGLSL